ncbi:hypothetical protein CRI94_01300 [Longibacter salinarum]|uniref:Uncharacterized protein n=1 Tax=Longibacter salinarum TaxID=1850348 RepID=A0A2A8D2B7_9BACT|nr:hypothetical protein [Longibacter salinarum]PEN14957.1 hypothetical protein CRI94_01300 [Longibacter salinarum]
MSPLDVGDEYEEQSPAYEEGWAAYHNELDRSENPHDAESDPAEFEEWDQGWFDALNEAEEIEQ